jgi:hypothetical protein
LEKTGQDTQVLHGWLLRKSDIFATPVDGHPANLTRRCIYIFTCAYGTSYGPVAWVLPSEVFPLSMRSKGVAVSTASNWLNNCAYRLFLLRDTEMDFVLFLVLIGLLTPKLMEMSVSYVSHSPQRSKPAGVQFPD